MEISRYGVSLTYLYKDEDLDLHGSARAFYAAASCISLISEIEARNKNSMINNNNSNKKIATMMITRDDEEI